MKYVFIINPKSGLTTVQKNVLKVVQRLLDNNHEVTVFETLVEGDAKRIAQNTPTCDLLVAVGGDGTVHEVVNGMMQNEFKATLAIIPAGTVNDLASHFKLPTKENGIFNYLTDFKVVDVDVGLANGTYFTNVIAAGFISDIGFKVDRNRKKLFGKFAYYIEAVFDAIRSMKKANRFKITIGEHTVELDAYMFIAINSTHLGGLSYFAPHASCFDGFIDLFIIKKTGLIGGFILLFEMLLGRHIEDHNVIYFKVKSFEVDCKENLTVDIDGEKGDKLPYKISVLKGALSLATLND